MKRNVVMLVAVTTAMMSVWVYWHLYFLALGEMPYSSADLGTIFVSNEWSVFPVCATALFIPDLPRSFDAIFIGLLMMVVLQMIFSFNEIWFFLSKKLGENLRSYSIMGVLTGVIPSLWAGIVFCLFKGAAPAVVLTVLFLSLIPAITLSAVLAIRLAIHFPVAKWKSFWRYLFAGNRKVFSIAVLAALADALFWVGYWLKTGAMPNSPSPPHARFLVLRIGDAPFVLFMVALFVEMIHLYKYMREIMSASSWNFCGKGTCIIAYASFTASVGVSIVFGAIFGAPNGTTLAILTIPVATISSSVLWAAVVYPLRKLFFEEREARLDVSFSGLR